jgi:ABC-type transporter Mla subunit MlaD
MDAFKSNFGDDPNYIAYRINREIEDDMQAKKAAAALGGNFKEIVAKDVSDGFTQLCIADLGILTADGGDFSENGGTIMGISTAELVAKIRGLQNSSEQLSAVVANASQELVRQANFLAQLTRGSRSGEEAANVVRMSSQSLNRAATTLKSLCQAGDEYIQNAVK